MTMHRRLRVLPDAERVEEALLEAAAGSGFVDGSSFITVGELIERLDGAKRLGRRPAPALTARVVLSACAQQLGGGPFGELIHEPSFARAALALCFEMKSGRLVGRALSEAIEALPASRVARPRYLAQLFSAYDAKMAELALADREDLIAAGVDRLEREGLPDSLAAFEAIELSAVHDFPPLRLALVIALAGACEKRGIAFHLEVPAGGSPGVDSAVDPILSAFEKTFPEARSVSAAKEDGIAAGRPLARLGRSLFSDVAVLDPSLGEALEIANAPSARDECEQIARKVAALVEQGVPPEQIAIAYRDLGDEAESLGEALERFGVPARIRHGAPLASTSVGRIALELPRWIDDGFPAEPTAWLLGNRYAPAVSMGARGSPRALLALASIRDDRVGAANGKGAYEVRLTQLAARRLELKSPGGGEFQAKEVRGLLARCLRLFEIGAKLPEHAPASEMLAAWWGALEALGVHSALKQAEPRGEEGTTLGRAVLHALARDQAADDALVEMVAELQSALRQSGAGKQPMRRRTFQRWLADAALDFNLTPKGARTGAVRILELRELTGRSFEHVFIGGLVDGRLPGRELPNPLLPDDDRRAINIHVGRDVFRLTTGEIDGRAPWRLAEDRLLFFLALSASRSTAFLSFARAADGGREQVASPFIDELERLTGKKPVLFPSRPLPLLSEVLTEDEFRERAALEALARTDLRTSEPDALGPALAQKLRAEPWFRFAREQVDIEQERLGFFSGTRPPGSFSGKITDAQLAPELERLFAFGPEHPASASMLGRFGNCAFQGYLGHALRLDEPSEPDEEIDPRDKGTFWHRVMELLFPALRDGGLLGKNADEIPEELIDLALAQASAEVEGRKHVGHPALWRLSRERARRMVADVLSADAHGLPFASAIPERTELAFGRPDADEPWRMVAIPSNDGALPVHVAGKIDRFDRGGGEAAVIDYKSGATLPRADALLLTEFQLPLYVFVARTAGNAQVQGAWLSLKSGEPKSLVNLLKTQTLEELISTDPEVQRRLEESGGKNLAVEVHKLVARLRGGDFSASPQECRNCSFRAVCRISQRRIEEDP